MKIKEQDSEHILLEPTIRERLRGLKRTIFDKSTQNIIIGKYTEPKISKNSVPFEDVKSISIERKEHYARYYVGEGGSSGFLARKREVHRHLEYTEWKVSIIIKGDKDIVVATSQKKSPIYDLANQLSLFLRRNLVDEGVVIPFAETQLWDRLKSKT